MYIVRFPSVYCTIGSIQYSNSDIENLEFLQEFHLSKVSKKELSQGDDKFQKVFKWIEAKIIEWF